MTKYAVEPRVLSDDVLQAALDDMTAERWNALREKEDPTLVEAMALGHHWRQHYDEPGFQQPPGGLVRAVEVWIGEDVWPRGWHGSR